MKGNNDDPFLLSRHIEQIQKTSADDSTSLNFALFTVSVTQTPAIQDVESGDFHCGRGALLGPLGLLVQALLAFIAFTSLIGNLSISISKLFRSRGRSPRPL